MVLTCYYLGVKTTISIEEITQNAVRSALKILDDATDGTTGRSASPCGDRLAYSLDELIQKSLREHFHSEFAPAFITASDLHG